MGDRVDAEAGVEDLWRRESPHVLAALGRRHGDLGDCEDAAQEALAAASVQWPRDGVPDHPRGWLITVASRRLVDQVRSNQARAAREVAVVAREPDEDLLAPPADAGDTSGVTTACSCSCSAATPRCRRPRRSRSPCARSPG